MNKEFKKLTVITYVDHIKNKNGQLISYTPYVREIDLWCELFDEVHIYAPGYKLTDNTSLTPFKYNNIKHHFLFYSNSSNRVGIKYTRYVNKLLMILRILQIPIVFCQLLIGIVQSEIINVRSPGFTAFISNIILIFISKKAIVKWAGGFHSFPGESIRSKVEREFLLHCNKNTRVLVYDKIDHPNFVKFIPALMSLEEIYYGLEVSKNKEWNGITNILCVGRLNPDKGFDLVLNALGIVKQYAPHFKWKLTFVGDGFYETNLKQIAENRLIIDQVRFVGALPFSKTKAYYAKANIVIMPGIKEGWPKVIAEAWAHNALVMAANRGNVPDILESGAGIPFEPESGVLANLLINYANGEINISSFLEIGRKEVVNYSMESFQNRISSIIKTI